MDILNELPHVLSNLIKEYIFDETPTNEDVKRKKRLNKIIHDIGILTIRGHFEDEYHNYYTREHFSNDLGFHLTRSEHNCFKRNGYHISDSMLIKTELYYLWNQIADNFIIRQSGLVF